MRGYGFDDGDNGFNDSQENIDSGLLNNKSGTELHNFEQEKSIGVFNDDSKTYTRKGGKED